MTARTDVSRSLPDRQHLGAQLRHARTAIGMNQRQLAALAGIRQYSVSYIETAHRDVLVSSLVDVAAAVGRYVALAAGHHLPLLNLTAAEVDEVIDAVRLCVSEYAGDPALSSALDKLTTTEETPDA